MTLSFYEAREEVDTKDGQDGRHEDESARRDSRMHDL